MDQIRDAIGFRAFSQRDPRIEFKRESARLFQEMQDRLRERVTDIAFKGRLQPQVPRGTAAASGRPTEAAAAPRAAAPVAAARPSVAAAAAMLAEASATDGTEEQRRDLELAEQAGSATAGGGRAGTLPAIGRNEVVTIEHPESGDRQELKWKRAEKLVKEEGWRLV